MSFYYDAHLDAKHILETFLISIRDYLSERKAWSDYGEGSLTALPIIETKQVMLVDISYKYH